MGMKSQDENLDLHPVAKACKLIDQVPIIDVGGLINDAQSVAAASAIVEPLPSIISASTPARQHASTLQSH